MSLEFTHKPNYFFYAQLLVRHIETYAQKHADADHVTFDLKEIYQLFREDFASTTTNLEGILNISDEYRVETLAGGDQKLISHYKIDAENNTLSVDFNQDALAALKQGKPLIAPNASLYQ
ncbi:hypothetical protein OK024_10165 [Acinetobacter sp. UGAL515B_02]|uniref:hypothetical protein n=1 Tax=Acinetobacter soli TaxID=487316 RepID=UPI001C46E097|nr:MULTISPECIES: hypothetical protein [Acinetobacter]MBV6551206.1 hypothetical protein [Acinetobacter soli]WON79298.1 hypothetical protein OK024_10165 [Acinetobacter sp. UGAL515B_02]